MDDEPASKCFKYNVDETARSIYFKKLNRLKEGDFNVPCINLARNLLGTVLVRRLNDGTVLKGKIVETECYLGNEDKASHSYNGRRTPRNEPMFMKPGTLYVYQTYGMYYCVNISSDGEGAAVLLRSIEPLIGFEKMSENRSNYHMKRKKTNSDTKKTAKLSISKTNYKPYELCNGPSKLCISFNINIENCNKMDLSSSSDLWLEERPDVVNESDIIISTRIGIESAGVEWASKLLRFYIYGNKSVSFKDKKREKLKDAKENL